MTSLVHRVESIIAKHRLLKDGDAVLVAVSGGVDSMVLLHVLHALGQKHRWKLVVAHLNHGLRGRAADLDEQFVASCAKKLKLRFESARADVKEFGRLRKISVEMAARQLRHDFLARTASALGIHKIALAHHADDQVELFFLRLLRGAGTQGLGGIESTAASPANRRIKLLRPLLEVTKTELTTYALKNKIAFREDSSNRSTEILRNRIRHKLLPFLRREFQPQIGDVVLRSMQLLRDEWDWLTMEALHCLETPRLARSFSKRHIAVQRRIVQIGLLKLGITPRFELVESLRAEPAQWVSVDARLLCRRTVNSTLETRAVARLEFQIEEKAVDLGATNEAAFDGIQASWRLVREKKTPGHVPNTENFDAAAVGTRILLRHWRAGDRFQPIGMKSAVKLQDWFVNQKIPRECRHTLVLATNATGEIFWVEGLRIGERFKVTPATKSRLEWRWNRK